MKSTLIAIFLLSTIFYVCAAPSSYLWITGNLAGFSISSAIQSDQFVDAAGNTFIIGSYTTSVTFSEPSPLLNGGRPGAYIVKIDPSGTFSWTNYITSETGNVAGIGIAVDASGNIYITGTFSDTATFLHDPNGVGPLTGRGMYIVKLDPSGNPVAKRIGNQENEVRISIDGHANIYVAGVFGGSFSFGTDTTTVTSLSGATFLYKFNSNLGFISATNTQGINNHSVSFRVQVATNTGGSTCVSATYDGDSNVYLDGLPPIFATGNNGGFVARFSPSLTAIYLTAIASTDVALTGGLDIDESDNCYIGGQFRTQIKVGSLVRTSASGLPYYFLKLNTSGNPVFLTTSQGVSIEFPVDVSCPPTGSTCYFTAALDPTPSSGSTFTFDSFTYSYIASGISALMVTRLNSAGSVDYIVSGTSPTTGGLSYGLAIDVAGNQVSVGGGIRGEILFGTLEFDSRTTSNTNNFILRFTDQIDNCPLCLAPNSNCCNLKNGRGICYNPSVHTCTPQGYLCPVGTSSCGVACYNRSVHVCLEGDFLCPVNHLRCGLACYNPAIYVCLDGNFLCPANHLRCGGACYLPSQYTCSNEQLDNATSQYTLPVATKA